MNVQSGVIRRLSGRLAAAGTLLLAVCSQASAAPELRVCLLAHSPPYASRDEDKGFDLDVAREVATKLGRSLQPVWTDNPVAIQEIEDSNIPLRRLTKGACDAILSVPSPAKDTLKEYPALALGAPYYGAAFELIGVAGTPPYLKDLHEKQVAIQAQTIASFAIAILQGKQRTYFSPRAALEGVQRGEAAAGLLWGPTAGWELQQSPKLALEIAKGYEPPPALAWNLCVATRDKDAALREALDGVLREMTAAGRLQALAARYGMPWHAPFATTYSLTEINKLR